MDVVEVVILQRLLAPAVCAFDNLTEGVRDARAPDRKTTVVAGVPGLRGVGDRAGIAGGRHAAGTPLFPLRAVISFVSAAVRWDPSHAEAHLLLHNCIDLWRAARTLDACSAPFAVDETSLGIGNIAQRACRAN